MKRLILFTFILGIIFNSYSQQTGTFKDSRDDKVYKTVKIGAQTWFAENFIYKPSSGNYWAFDNNTSNVAKYGYLYEWETAKKACPVGWHLPVKEEFETLLNNVGGTGNVAYQALIEIGSSGFSAPFGGYRSGIGNFNYGGTNDYFWSSSPFNKDNAWSMTIRSPNKEAYMSSIFMSCGFSVRCLQDN